MRARTLVALVATTATCVALPLSGCVDLFHSTDFAATTADASVAEAGADATTQEICAATPEDALATAKRSCALLSACESPIGDNAIGRCLPNAILAYDCTVSPTRPILGAVRNYWVCLASATTCAEVEKCVYGNVARDCPATGAFTNCPGESSARADCEPPSTKSKSENCAAAGRVCTPNGGGAGYCTGTAGLGCTGAASCDGTQLHACATSGPITLEDGGKGTLDEGFDCANYGDGTCVQNTLGAFCNSTGTAACAATDAVKCDGDVAIGCNGGTEERVNCAALTGAKGTCRPTVGGRVWDVSRACGIPSTDGGTGCARDTCSKDKLSACVRGVTIEIDCAALEPALGVCRQIDTFDGARPACGRP